MPNLGKKVYNSEFEITAEALAKKKKKSGEREPLIPLSLKVSIDRLNLDGDLDTHLDHLGDMETFPVQKDIGIDRNLTGPKDD